MFKFGLCFLLCWILAVAAFAQQAVLYVGRDWCEAGEPLEVLWKTATLREAANVPLVIVDEPESVTEATQAKWKAQGSVAMKVDRYPAMAYFDAMGRCVFLKEGVPFSTSAETLLAWIQEGKARATRIQTLLAEETASAAYAAIQLLLPELGLRRTKEPYGLKEAWALLRAKDPEDHLQYQWALNFDPMTETYAIQALAKEQAFVAAEQRLQRYATPERLALLSLPQKQGLKLLWFVLYRQVPEKHVDNVRCLREVVAMGEETLFGQGAAGMLCSLGKGPVAIPYGWATSHVVAGEQTWTITMGVSKTLTDAGNYCMRFERTAGQGKMQLLGMKVVCGKKYAAVISDVNAFTLMAGEQHTIPFSIPAQGTAIELQVAFDSPDAVETGTLTLAHCLPARAACLPEDVESLMACPQEATQETRAIYAMANRSFSPMVVKAIASRTGGTLFLKAFFQDPEWMSDFLGAGPVKGSWDQALATLDQIVANCPEVLSDPSARKWATAAALNSGEAPKSPAVQALSSAESSDSLRAYAAQDVAIVRLVQAFLDVRKAKLLVRGADALPIGLMRFVLTPKQLDADAVRWIVTQHHVPPRTYDNVCWFAPYRLNNFFGDSIHGSAYYRPWDHCLGRQAATRSVGGVCGSLSYYGSVAAKAHGIPSTPGGQPGHCAYARWSQREQRWVLCYTIAPYTFPHFFLWKEAFAYLDLVAQDFLSPTATASNNALWEAIVTREKLEPQPHYSPLTLQTYRWKGRTLPTQWETLTPLECYTNQSHCDLTTSAFTEKVAMRWQGTFTLAIPATPHLSITSDDGSRVWIDGQLVLDNDGCHGPRTYSAMPQLTAGEHTLEVQYFNFEGGRTLALHMAIHYPYNAAIADRYLTAAQCSPSNYAAWLAYDDYLAECSEVPLKAWEAFARAAATALSNALLPAWQLLDRHYLPLLQERQEETLMLQKLCELHSLLREGSVPTAEFCDYTAILNHHAALLNQKERALFALFQADLLAQYGSVNAFPVVLKWGAERFLKSDTFAPKFMTALTDLVRLHGTSNVSLAPFLATTLRSAAQAGNLTAFQQLSDLYDQLTPQTRQPLNLTFTTATLLSDKGLLTTSSTSQWDQPSKYRHVIDGLVADGNFHTESEMTPWVQIQLPGRATIQALFLENIHTQNDGRLLPFKIEVSLDGQTWQTVYEGYQSQAQWEITLQPAVQGNFIRLTRITDEAHHWKTFLHLRKFMIFGQKHY